MRGWVVGIAALGVLVGASAPAGAQPADGQAEPVAVAVTNTGTAPCRLSSVVDGNLAVTDLRHAGSPVSPEVSEVAYEDNPTPDQATFTALAPGATARFTLDPATDSAGRPALRTVSFSARGASLASTWPVAAAGDYRLTVAVGWPAGPGVLADQCRGLVGTAAFTVAAPAGYRFAWWWVAAGVGALLVVLAVVWLVRRRGRVATGAALALLLVAGLVSLGAAPQRAWADIDDTGASGEAATTLSGCLSSFRAKDGDPARVMSTLDSPNAKVKIVPYSTKDNSHVSSTSATGVGQASVYWAWWRTPEYRYPGDRVLREPCASLYHELVHAYDMARGSFDPRWCDDMRVSTEDVRAVLAENRYRATHKGRDGKPMPPRTKYGYYGTIPASLDKCKEPPTQNWGPPPAGDIGEDCLDACGTTNGDPHLRTFDGRFYDFQAAGEFDAVVSRDDALRVQVRQQPYPGSDVVSVNTAVAANVTGSRVEVRQADMGWQVLVDGQDDTDPSRALPGGGAVAQWADGSQRYALLSWPDGTRARVRGLGAWGLALDMSPSAARRDQFTGLLGDDNGSGDDDLVTRDGQRITDTSFPGFYRGFGESWRIRATDSLFSYPPGRTTDGYTDRAFPHAPADASRLPGRAAAEAVCRQLGVTTPELLAACTLDVALTGQASFADSAVITQRTVPGTAAPGRALHDGDTVTGSTSQPDQRVEYPLDVPDAQVLRLVDVTGDPKVELVGPEVTETPGFTVTDPYLYRLQPGAAYQLAVSRATPGQYAFRVAVDHDRRLPLAVGDRVDHGRIDLPGRVDLYQLGPVSADTSVRLAEGAPCDDITAALVEDNGDPHAYTPYQLCSDVDLGRLEPGVRYLLAVWSDRGIPGDYTFRLVSG